MTARRKPKAMGVKETVYPTLEAWMVGRLGKITGSGAKETVNVRDGETKAGVWRAAAESIIGSAAIAEDDLTSAQILQRGHDLEPVAIKRFEEATGKKARHGHIIWEREDDTRMGVSPDAPLGKDMTEALEVKCLLSTKHVEAIFKQDIPKNTSGYEEQKLQYFIANPLLETLYWGFYHPDFPAGLDFFYLTFTREALQLDIEKYLMAEREAAAKIREIVNVVTLRNPQDVATTAAIQKELLAGEGKETVTPAPRKRAKKVVPLFN